MRPEATWRTEESATISTFCQPLFCVTFESYCSKTASIIHKPLNLLTLHLLAHLRVLCEKKGRERAPQPIAGLLLAGVHSNRRPVLLLFPRFVNHYFYLCCILLFQDMVPCFTHLKGDQTPFDLPVLCSNPREIKQNECVKKCIGLKRGTRNRTQSRNPSDSLWGGTRHPLPLIKYKASCYSLL